MISLFSYHFFLKKIQKSVVLSSLWVAYGHMLSNPPLSIGCIIYILFKKSLCMYRFDGNYLRKYVLGRLAKYNSDKLNVIYL